jgi:formylmethanofuran dehydrogenase subunit E
MAKHPTPLPAPELDAPLRARLAGILAETAARHRHLCPRQVLGARMALAASELLGVDVPRGDKRLLAIAETDGCFLSGLEVAAGTLARHRTLRILDYGKVAVTFADTRSGRAVRLAPRAACRAEARRRAPAGVSRLAAMVAGYRSMATALLLTWQEVELVPSIRVLVSRPHVRTPCARCGEEIVNEREVRVAGRVLCRACAHGAYYRVPSRERSRAPS